MCVGICKPPVPLFPQVRAMVVRLASRVIKRGPCPAPILDAISHRHGGPQPVQNGAVSRRHVCRPVVKRIAAARSDNTAANGTVLRSVDGHGPLSGDPQSVRVYRLSATRPGLDLV